MQCAIGYEELITAAVEILLNDAGSHGRPDLGPGVRSLHLMSSRDRVGDGVRKILRPRHFVIYRQVDNTIQVVRLLHDAMNLPEQPIP